MSTNELKSKVQELRELKTLAEELQAEITAIEDVIKEKMILDNIEELQVGAFKIRWTKVNSNRFDTTAFKNKYADLYSQYLKQNITRRFSIV